MGNKYQDQAQSTGKPVVRKSTTGATVTYQPSKTPTTPVARPNDRRGNSQGSTRGNYLTGADAADRQAQTYYAQGGQASTNAKATQNNMFEWDPARGKFMNAADYMTTNKPQSPWPTQPTNPNGGGGGGGGGGSAAADAAKQAADWQAYVSAMKGMLGQITPAAVPMAGMVDPAVNADIANARQAYGQVAGQIPMNDPYLALAAMKAPTVGNEMEQFLRGQGADTQQYGNTVDYANAQLGAGAQNWQGYAQAQGANHLVAQQRIADLARLQGENVVQGFEGQRAQLNAQVAQQQAAAAEAAKQQKMQLILQMIQAAGQYGQAAPDVTGLLG